MHQMRCRLVAFGFAWMALWALMGSLLGYRLQEELTLDASPWLTSLTRELLRSTHAHMNAMSMVCMILGLALPLLARSVAPQWLARAAALLPLSVITFGAGLLWEALVPPTRGAPSPGGLVAALGGSCFILVTLFFGVAFWRAARHTP